ncbi:uncharacterized protein SPAPADRAFT_59707 [Spathaspora passalidarum NRRL Y-27907]|uniref:Protein KRE1 n=1 Tax=Spathaspora passalidarum (strain NRRL Y-27907 / 11-Y1) TaxID=619300 RepID=G3AHX6_SPAPN|nr:uncharacterized protein SPAPADRAFT_59707 [Spathaspora passalidarum NRRL Y-27907]EGW34290.1 hypothetical protein SPAPADRAFT_59707 [Spathaspora passalidarum NRRL Y-27907]
MKFNFFPIFFICISLVLAADAPTTTASPTLVWVTGTDANGILRTTQSPYTQQFSTFFTSVAAPSSGVIGLGTISGSVGEVRTYDIVTITHNGGGASNFALGFGDNMEVSAIKYLGLSLFAFISLVLFI